MTDQLVLAFDMGTQSIRALLINPKGDILCKAQKAFEPVYYSTAPGRAEQKPAVYWDALVETSRALKAKAGGLWNNVIAVTLATIRETCVCLGENNEPVRDAIVWVDDRTVDTKDLPPLPVGIQVILKLSRLSALVEMQRKKSHCNWIAVYQPDIWKKTKTYTFISTWLNYKLTGVLADSYAGMIGHMPYDNKLRSWMKSSDLRRMVFALDNGRLCPLVAPGDTLGTITAEASGQMGIAQGLPLIATGSDKGCETLGVSCLSSEKAAISFGTTATVQVSTKTWFEPVPNMPAYTAIAPGYYNPEIQIYRGYWLLSWFKREFAVKEIMQAESLGISAEQLLDKRLQEIPPGCDGLILQPYFTSSPDMLHARGVAAGLSGAHTRIHLYRAIIEGINFALLQGLETLQQRGGLRITKIFVAGGGSQSDEICRITASQFGLPVYRTQTYEACGIGEAMAAFVSKGIFSSYEQAVSEMVHVKDEFLPDKNACAIYRELYERIFLKLFARLSPLYEEIDSIIKCRNQSGGQ
ncbi:MAG: FGGY-family carbohydrate kinase [Treponemataceae bacterium]|nr:MAG: FGGY-family carbohydrate kinase [Treponemataceae bacterium]